MRRCPNTHRCIPDFGTVTHSWSLPFPKLLPFPISSRSTPYQRDHEDPAPIRRENFSRPYRSSVSDQLSPVLEMQVDPQRDPRPGECWNCQKLGHRYSECSEPKAYFCYKCGKPKVRVDNCPKCYRSYQPPPDHL